jgi:hypothetical protein
MLKHRNTIYNAFSAFHISSRAREKTEIEDKKKTQKEWRNGTNEKKGEREISAKKNNIQRQADGGGRRRLMTAERLEMFAREETNKGRKKGKMS